MENSKKKLFLINLHQKAEELLKKTKKKSDISISETETLKLIHEYEVQSIEIELQLEELQQTISEKTSALDKYNNLYDFAPVGYFTLSKSGIIIELNLAGAELLDRDRSHLLSRRLVSYISIDTKPVFNNFLEKIFSSNLKESCEVTLSINDQEPRFVDIKGIADGESENCLINLTDITTYKKTLELFRKSEEKFKILVNNAFAWEFWQSPASDFIYVSPSFERITGYPLKSILENPSFILEIVHYDDRSSYLDHLEEIKQSEVSKKTHNHLFRILNINGETRYLDHICYPIFDENRKYLGIRGSFNDITERMLAQIAMKESEEKYHTLFHSMAQGVIYYNSDGFITEANPSAMHMLGLTFDQMIGHTLKNPEWKMMKEDGSIFPEDEHPSIEALRTGKQAQSVIGVFNPVLKKTIWININATPLKKEGEEFPYQVFTTLHDISVEVEVNLTKEEINTGLSLRSEELEKGIKDRMTEIIQLSRINSTIVNNMGLGLITTSEDGIIQSFNPEAEKMLGYSAGELIGIASPLIFHKADEIEKEATHLDKKTGLKTKLPFDVFKNISEVLKREPKEWTLIKKGGEEISVLLSVTQMNSWDGSVNGYIGVILDITQKKKAEEQLFRNESLLQLMSSSSPLGFLLVDNNTDKILYFNHRFCELWEITSIEEQMKRGEFLNNDIIPYCLPQLKDIEAFALSCAPLQDVENRETIEDEIPFKHDRTIRRYSTQIREKNDEYFGRFYIFEDITARKNAELSLRMQNAAFESFSLAVAITDADAVLEWANPAFSELTGYPLEEVIGQNVKILNSGKMPNEYYKEMWEALLSLKVWTGELINKRKDGTNYWEEETITPILDEKGELIRFIAIKIDITHRKEMENALRISEARWQAALDGSGDGIWDWNTETNEVFFSQQWKTMLGYDTKDVGNTLKEWSDRVFQEDLQSCYNDLNLHFMSESEFYVNEHRMLCKDKTYKWVLDRGKVVHWIEPGKPGRVIVTQTDINESKKFEASLKESIEREKELNEIKSRFVSTASHEFRTPLASILITSDSLKAYWGKLEESQIRDKLTKINNQVFHLTKIVNDVLNISRIEEGKLEINPTETDIVELCSKVVETFNSDPLLKTKIIFESQYSRINLNIDTRLIIQVINNLISNGLKYSPENPEVKVEVILNKEELSISISDNGIGIPEKDKAHLFTPFFRGSNTGSIQGTGLGLNIVKGYVLLHGGSITYKSKPGKGTTFVIHFPAGLITTFK